MQYPAFLVCSTLNSYLSSVSPIYLYNHFNRQAPGQNDKMKATMLAMNTDAATGGQKECFLNAEKLRDDKNTLIENGMALVDQIRQVSRCVYYDAHATYVYYICIGTQYTLVCGRDVGCNVHVERVHTYVRYVKPTHRNISDFE
jgi:hypothetical protein